MPNKFATLVTVAVIALLVYLAFQNFYKPGEGFQNPLAANKATSNRSFELQTYSHSWPIPGTNLTFQHNYTVNNGKRIDVLDFSAMGSVNLSQVANLSVLVIVPKSLAANMSQILVVPQQRVTVLNYDPTFEYSLSGTKCLREDETGLCTVMDDEPLELYIKEGEECENSEDCPKRTIMVVPMPPDMEMTSFYSNSEYITEGPGMAFLEQLEASGDLFKDLPQAEADALSEQLTTILFNSNLPIDYRIPIAINRIQAYASRSTTSGQTVGEESEISSTASAPLELYLTVSEFSPKGVARFALPRNAQAQGAPQVAVRGQAANYHTTAIVEGSVVIVASDLSDVPQAGGLFAFDQIPGRIELYYPQTGYRFTITLTIRVNHVYDATLVAPRALPGGVGGELLFIVPNLQKPIEQVELQGEDRSCGLDASVDIPAADPANPKAVVFYVPQEVKSAVRQHGECYFVDQRGGVVPTQVTISSSLTRANELQSLMPFIANLDVLQPGQRWNGCSEAYCGCTAARQALESAVAKTKADARKFYGPGYTLYQNKFWRFYLFNVATVEGCNFGATPLQDAAPGEIQVVAIGVNPANLQQVVAKSFHGENNIQPISAVQGVNPDEIKRAVTSPWLCFDPSGLPQSLPDNSCSAEQRGGQAIAQR